MRLFLIALTSAWAVALSAIGPALAGPPPAGPPPAGFPGPALADLGEWDKLPRLVLDGPEPELKTLALVREAPGPVDLERITRRLKAGDFEVFTQDRLNNLGFTPDVLWLACRVTNRLNKGSETMLDVVENNLSDVRLYLYRQFTTGQGAWSFERNGSLVPVSRRTVKVISLSFNAALPPLSDSLLLLRIDNRGPNRLNVSLESTGRLMAKLQVGSMLLFAGFGAMFILVLYNIMLFITVRDRVFLWFTLHLLFTGLYIQAVSGGGYFLFWPGLAAFQAFAAPFFTCCIIVSIMQFLREFLSTRSAMPRLDRALLVNMVICLPTLLLVVFQYSAGMLVGGAVVFISILMMFLVLGVGISRGSRDARIFIGGYLILVAGAVLTQLTTYGFISSGWPLQLASRADFAGIILEASFFSFILSSRVRALRSQRDEAEAKSAFKQQFIANISHEMRTPLNAVMGFAESALVTDDAQAIRQYNRLILTESERLLFQINQVLDFAKLDAGRLSLDIQPFSLNESIAYLQSIYAEKAGQQHLELSCRVEGSLAAGVRGDRLRIEQVLRNLLDNALKFTEDGGVILSVSCRPAEPGMLRVGFAVSDTGIGIPADKQRTIFEEFVQADPSITRRFGGTGLGTAIARRLVLSMGGDLELRSRPGLGTTFSFELLLPECPAPVPTAPDLPEPVPAAAAPGSANRWSCLVVDDFETNRQVVSSHLANMAVDLDQAASGEAALALIAGKHYDLVLLDLFMPGMSGFDVARHIRQNPQTRTVPVLGLTASSDEADLRGALDAGMDGIMVKPIKRRDLLARIRDYLPELG